MSSILSPNLCWNFGKFPKLLWTSTGRLLIFAVNERWKSPPMNLLQSTTVCFDDNGTGQQNQQTPLLPPHHRIMIAATSSSSSSSIGDGLDHMRLPFAYKLHILLCDMETKGSEHVISWVKDGKAFKIHDRKTFETQIQPRYFRQSKIASFIRQVRLSFMAQWSTLAELLVLTQTLLLAWLVVW